jgi:hypothetical protein
MNFKRFLMIMEYLDAGSAVALPSSWTGSEQPDNMMSQPVFLPSMDLGLPATTKVGKIALMIKDKNPIMMQLDDGTQLFFSYDQFRRITGSPALGRTMTVVFQRDYTDRSKAPSQIASCSVT